MPDMNDAGSAWPRSPASNVVFAGAIDGTQLPHSDAVVQIVRVVAHRYGLSPATAQLVAELAFPSLDARRAGA